MKRVVFAISLAFVLASCTNKEDLASNLQGQNLTVLASVLEIPVGELPENVIDDASGRYPNASLESAFYLLFSDQTARYRIEMVEDDWLTFLLYSDEGDYLGSDDDGDGESDDGDDEECEDCEDDDDECDDCEDDEECEDCDDDDDDCEDCEDDDECEDCDDEDGDCEDCEDDDDDDEEDDDDDDEDGDGD
jgi:hypothetical protein